MRLEGKFALLMVALALLGLTPHAADAQIAFVRSGKGPLIAGAGANKSWHGTMAANPVAISFQGTYFLYARGIATPHAPSTVGVWTAPPAGFDGVTWNQHPVEEPILQAGAEGTFDSTGIYDPSAVVFRGKVFLYYQGTGAKTSTIGLATSSDGLHFSKAGMVLPHGGTPFPVVDAADAKLYLFYTRRDAAKTGWEYWVATSDDGLTFGPGRLVFSPTGVEGTFDARSIITIRVMYEAPYYYMTYGGSPTCIDYPEGIGLARSTDLLHWTRYPENPVIHRGAAGTWDEAALWSGSVLKVNGVYYMWYEATGSGAGAGTAASDKARDVCYGGYGRTSWSQVGLAMYSGASLGDWGAAAK